MIETLLTICLPTTVDRRPKFYNLLRELLEQIDFSHHAEKIEILIDEDAKEKTIGLKRQQLLERATGKFVVGIDSDDAVSPEYINQIMKAIEDNPDTDHVGFLERCSIDGVMSKSIFSIRHQKWAENTDGFDHIRCANPKSVIRRTIALEAGYKDLRYAEDIDFSERVTPLLKSEVFIDKQLYFYNHTSSEFSERYGIKD